MVVVRNPLANEGDIRESGSIPRLGRSAGGGKSIPLQHSCLENPIDRGTWQATVHRVAQSWTAHTHWRVGPQFVDLFTYRLRLLLFSWDHEQRKDELWYPGCCMKMNYQKLSRSGMAESYGIYTFTLKKKTCQLFSILSVLFCITAYICQ